MTGKSLDNRAGCAVVIDAACRLAGHPDLTLIVSLSSQEEIGCRGARPIAFAADPGEAIVVDVSFADGPDVPPRACGKMGGGPMIGVSPILNKPMTDRLIALAKALEIPHQLEVMGSHTGTNADLISLIKCGVPTALISVPERNMHTACEVIDPDDVRRCSELIVAYVEKGGEQDA